MQRGVEHLEALGYRPVISGHALDRGPLYYAGTSEERLADLHAAFANPEIDGIICTRGGWGSAELLPYLDAGLIRANPKAFIGYSDHTALHCWLQNEVNLVTFYGPMVAADFARNEGVELTSWQRSVGGDESWTLGAGDGLRVLRPGTSEGVLLGGCHLDSGREALAHRTRHVQRAVFFFWRTSGRSHTNGTGCCCIYGTRGVWRP